MTDYISREALRKELIDARKDYSFQDDKPWDLGFHNGLSIAQRILDELPAADVRPVVRGKWQKCLIAADRQYDTNGMSQIIECYVCDACNNFSVLMYRYCPNCGADMREES